MKTLDPEPIPFIVDNQNLAAGTNTLANFTVPIGGLYRLTYVSFYYTGTVTNVFVWLRMTIAGQTVNISRFGTLTSAVPVNSTYDILLGSGWSMDWYIVGATAGNDFLGASFIQRLR